MLLKKLVCFVRGHSVLPTGRHAILLREWWCSRCGGRYVSHRDFGDALLAADDDFDRIVADFEDAKVRFHPLSE